MGEKLNSVLCVNDNEITLFIMRRMLKNADFAAQIIEKNDGSEALDYCSQLITNGDYLTGNYPRLIFLDIHMPVMNGWEFLEHFSQKISPYFPETRVTITSQSIDRNDSMRAKVHPLVLDFLELPLSTATLLNLRERLEEGCGLTATY